MSNFTLEEVIGSMELFPGPFWIKKASDRTMLYLNSHYERLCGRSLEEYRGKTDAELWAQETAERYKEYDERAIEANGLTSLNICVVDGKHVLISKRLYGDANHDGFITGSVLFLSDHYIKSDTTTLLRSLSEDMKRSIEVIEEHLKFKDHPSKL